MMEQQTAGFIIERGVLKQYIGNDTVVELPDGITELGYRAFYGNHTITQVKLPHGVVKIGLQAFADCSNLQDIQFPNSLQTVGWNAFHNTAWYQNQPDGIVYIANLAFQVKGDLRQITSATILPGTVKLCADLFRNCTALTEVHLPDSLRELDDRTFQHCRKLKQIELPPKVERIGDRVFDECTNLSVLLHGETTTIGRHCFMPDASVHVLHLHPAKLPDNVRNSAIKSFADDWCSDIALDATFIQQMIQYIQNRRTQYYPLALEHWNLMQVMLEHNIIPAEDIDYLLEQIIAHGQADHAAALMQYKQRLSESTDELDLFNTAWDDLSLEWDIEQIEKSQAELEQEWGTKALSDGTYALTRYYGAETAVHIPQKIGNQVITAIAPYAVSPNRYGIKHESAEVLKQIYSVTIPEGITRIGNNAFQGCTALCDVTIPQSVEYIGRDAFADCKWKP